MISLYHAGNVVIREPDIHHGRKNADFGQGFYTTDDYGFACRWVREKPGAQVIINHYELDTNGLRIKKFERDREWFEYIFANRRLRPDIYLDFDVIIGPIANDTIYETFGIITSGYLSDEEAMKLLLVGPCSHQIVLKTQRAADNLRFASSEALSGEELEENLLVHEKENKSYQEEFAKAMSETVK